MLPHFGASAHHLLNLHISTSRLCKDVKTKTRKNDYEQYIKLYERLQQGYHVIRVNGVNGFGEDLFKVLVIKNNL